MQIGIGIGVTNGSFIGVAGGVAELEGMLPTAVAEFSDASGWVSSSDYDISGGKLTYLNTTTAVNALSTALPTNILENRHYAVFTHVTRRDAGGIYWYGTGVSGGSQQGSSINGARRVLSSFVANRDIDEFGLRGTPFDGDVTTHQIYDITDEISGQLDIHILAGQSNMVGASSTTGFDSLTEALEMRALSISGTDDGSFKFETDQTGPTINAALGADDGIGVIKGGMIEPMTHSSANFQGAGPATSIANVICDRSTVRPIFACMAHGATDLFDGWDHTYTGTGAEYDLMVANVDHVRGLNAANQVKTFFWCQGESSTHTGYAAQFKAMIDTLRAAWGQFAVVIMEHGGDAASAGHINMKAEQQKLATGSGDASELTRCIYVERPTGAVLEADGTHFTGTTNRTRGTEAAQAAIAAGFLGLLVAPSNLLMPSVSPNSANVGDVLTCSPGSWSGNPTPDFSYQWFLDGEALPSETSQSISTSLSGYYNCQVKAANSAGSASETSNSVPVALTLIFANTILTGSEIFSADTIIGAAQ